MLVPWYRSILYLYIIPNYIYFIFLDIRRGDGGITVVIEQIYDTIR